jgi:hypothetical protein
LQELLVNLIGNQNSTGTSKPTLNKTSLSKKTNSDDTIINGIKEKESNKSESIINIKD